MIYVIKIYGIIINRRSDKYAFKPIDERRKVLFYRFVG